MKNYKLQYLVLFMALAALLSCGDAKQADLRDEPFVPRQFNLSCQLDTSRFVDFFTKDLSRDIDCLNESLMLFIRVVETKHPGQLTKKELEEYIQRRIPDFDPQLFKSLELAFDLNYLIRGDQEGLISQESLAKLVEFFTTLNREARSFYFLISSPRTIKFPIHRAQRAAFKQSLDKVVIKLKGLINEDGVRELNLLEIIDHLVYISEDSNVIKAQYLLFIKSMLLGGKEDFITNKEVSRLMDKISNIGVFFFDLFKLNKLENTSSSSLFSLLLEDVRVLKNSVIDFSLDDDSKTLFTIDQLTKALDVYMPDMVGNEVTWRLNDFPEDMAVVKKVLVGNDNKGFTGRDIATLFAHIENLLETGEVFYSLYEDNKQLLSKSGLIDVEELKVLSRWKPKTALVDQFKRIINDYKFYKGTFNAPVMSHDFSRNKEGIFEYAVWEYGLGLVFKQYGCPPSEARRSQCLVDIGVESGTAKGLGIPGEYLMTIKSLMNVMYDIEDFLIASGLMLENYVPNMAENIALLSSLFMYRSNGDEVIDISEASEFFLSVFTAISIVEKMHPELKEICATDSQDRIEPACFRERVFDIFTHPQFNVIGYRDSFPGLFRFLDTASYKDIYQLSLESERAAMVCPLGPADPHDEVHVSKGDMMTFFVILFNIESTIIRFDANRNNRLDPEEINEAYGVYKPAIIGIIDSLDMPVRIPMFWGATPRGVYRFLVAEERVPGPLDIHKLIGYNIRCKSCVAERRTIATILKNIKLNSPENLDNPFNCETLKD